MTSQSVSRESNIVNPNIAVSKNYAFFDLFQYEETNGVISLTGFNESSLPSAGDLIVPAELEGLRVVSIGERAFFGCVALKSVLLPEGVQTIDAKAFAGCSSLSLATIPDSVETIADDAFDDCPANLKFIVYEESDAERWAQKHDREYDSLPSPTAGVFGWDYCDGGIVVECLDCDRIPENGILIIPAEIRGKPAVKIGGCSFDEFFEIKKIVIPDTVKEIGEGAFLEEVSLTKVVIPNSVERIGDDVFAGCRALTTIVEHEDNDDEIAFLPRNVKRYGERVFTGCSSLKRVVVPEGVEIIGTEVFDSCEAMVSINVPSSVKEIGKHAFWECLALSDVLLSEGLEVIGEAAFDNCRSLAELYLPQSLREIADDAFIDCPAVFRVHKDSYAWRWAIEHDREFMLIDVSDE